MSESRLPIPVISQLFEYLSSEDLHSAKQVCRDWYKVSQLRLHRRKIDFGVFSTIKQDYYVKMLKRHPNIRHIAIGHIENEFYKIIYPYCPNLRTLELKSVSGNGSAFYEGNIYISSRNVFKGLSKFKNLKKIKISQSHIDTPSKIMDSCPSINSIHTNFHQLILMNLTTNCTMKPLFHEEIIVDVHKKDLSLGRKYGLDFSGPRIHTDKVKYVFCRPCAPSKPIIRLNEESVSSLLQIFTVSESESTNFKLFQCRNNTHFVAYEDERISSDETTEGESFLKLIPRLRVDRVRCLTLENYAFVDALPENIGRVFPDLETLGLISVKNLTKSAVVEFIVHCPKLKSIKLSGYFSSQYSDEWLLTLKDLAWASTIDKKRVSYEEVLHRAEDSVSCS